MFWKLIDSIKSYAGIFVGTSGVVAETVVLVSEVGTSTGKKYFEIELTAYEGSPLLQLGVMPTGTPSETSIITQGAIIISSDGIAGSQSNSDSISPATTLAAGDIICGVVDCDLGNIYLGINGEYVPAATWTLGAFVEGQVTESFDPEAAPEWFIAACSATTGGNVQVTLRVIEAEFTHEMPEGCTPWGA